MRPLPFIAMLFAGACAQPPMTFPLAPAGPLDAHGVPPTFSACVRDKVRTYTQIYDVFYECQPYLVSYVGHLPLTQQQKAERLAELEKSGMNLSHEVAVAKHGDRALPPRQPPPAPSAQPAARAPNPSAWANTPAAQPWRDCILAELRSRDVLAGPVATLALTVAARCNTLFKGPPDQDIAVTVMAVEGIRERAPGAYVIDQQPTPRGELRF